jgi:hypothetical protein
MSRWCGARSKRRLATCLCCYGYLPLSACCGPRLAGQTALTALMDSTDCLWFPCFWRSSGDPSTAHGSSLDFSHQRWSYCSFVGLRELTSPGISLTSSRLHSRKVIVQGGSSCPRYHQKRCVVVLLDPEIPSQPAPLPADTIHKRRPASTQINFS